MQVHEPIHISTRDRVMRAWQNSMELVRDYQLYAREVSDPSISELFSRCAEEECQHASDFHAIILHMDAQRT